MNPLRLGLVGRTLTLGCLALAGLSFAAPCPAQPKMTSSSRLPQTPVDVPAGKAVATFATGCFWCTEAVFQALRGVEKVTSGYAGGHLPSPTYEQVGTKRTGHAEAIQVIYDPAVVDYKTLLEAFWKTHDPTTLNRQGADIGPQYRSAIFTHDDEQRQLAESYKRKLGESGAFDDPIVTEITPFSNFYPAETYHQNYYTRNPGQGYCQIVIAPKLKKFREVFADKLKTSPDDRGGP